MSVWLEHGLKGGVDKLGLLRISVPFGASTMAEAISGTPDGYSGLGISVPIVNRTFDASEDGMFSGVLFCEGTASDLGGAFPSDDNVEYELDGSTGEDPIESHPDFGNTFGTAEDAIFEGDEFKGFKKTSELYGQTSFLQCGLRWRRTFFSRNFPSGLFQRLGRIDSPPGNPPGLEDGRNWLKISVRGRSRGDGWQISDEWLASGRGGWKTLVYKTTD